MLESFKTNAKVISEQFSKIMISDYMIRNGPKTIPNISQNYARYIPNTFQTHPENILKTFKNHPKNIINSSQTANFGPGPGPMGPMGRAHIFSKLFSKYFQTFL